MIINDREVAYSILNAKNGDIIDVSQDIKIVVIKTSPLEEQIIKLEKLIVEKCGATAINVEHKSTPIICEQRINENEGNEEAHKNGWIKHPCCSVCGTTKRKQCSGSRCTRCYFKKIKQFESKKNSTQIRKTPSGYPKDERYCNYIGCPDRGKTHKTEDMIEVNGRFYCTESCYEKNTLKMPLQNV